MFLVIISRAFFLRKSLPCVKRNVVLCMSYLHSCRPKSVNCSSNSEGLSHCWKYCNVVHDQFVNQREKLTIRAVPGSMIISEAWMIAFCSLHYSFVLLITHLVHLSFPRIGLQGPRISTLYKHLTNCATKGLVGRRMPACQTTRPHSDVCRLNPFPPLRLAQFLSRIYANVSTAANHFHVLSHRRRYKTPVII